MRSITFQRRRSMGPRSGRVARSEKRAIPCYDAAMADLASIAAKLRKAALAYPGAVEEFPWGDRVFKVNKKIFAFADVHDRALHVTAKLPQSGPMALLLPFAEPTGYNLGKSGWV